MSISFACEECGKSFTLDDKFAGKKGRCKGCGALMQIPGSNHTSHAMAEDATSRRAVSKAALADDIYGFEDAPLPPRTPTYAPSAADSPSNASPIVKKKKKKAKGFFAGMGGKANSSSSGFSIGAGSSRALLGVSGVILTALILPALRGSFNGFAPRSEIVAFYQQTIDRTEQLTALLRKINDVETARQMSSAVKAKLKENTKYLRENMNRKGKKSEIQEVTAQFAQAQQRTVQALIAEFDRLGTIDGVGEALDIRVELDEQISLEKSIEASKNQNDQ